MMKQNAGGSFDDEKLRWDILEMEPSGKFVVRTVLANQTRTIKTGKERERERK